MKLGWRADEEAFRLLAPKATAVALVTRRHPAHDDEREQPMVRVGPGVWEARLSAALGHGATGSEQWKYYRFRVTQPEGTFDLADPWATAVARKFALGHPTWAVAHQEPFDWQGDARPGLDVGSAVLLELHVRDFTHHGSAQNRFPGTYLGLVEAQPGTVGGLPALRDLGVNAVELMPVATWPYLESIPLKAAGKNAEAQGNPTGVNHWGYMPSFLLAPAERFTLRGATAKRGQWVGVDDDGTFHDPGVEFKQMVRGLHAAGLAVVLDVVFNHVSMHDDNPLLRLDPGTWFHRNADGTLRSDSGCGNDLNTTDPAMRKLVLDTVLHWLREYHVDGFRLDLAAILDDETLRAVRAAALAEYPRAMVISEPWSMASYRPTAIAALGHTVWNDRFRNAMKGRDAHSPGMLFGAGHGGATRGDTAVLLGGWSRDLGGPFESPRLTLNYLESHDNHTLGDFARLVLGVTQPVRREDMVFVSGQALRVHKLAAAILLLSRGAVMLAQGQEWARAKVRPAKVEAAKRSMVTRHKSALPQTVNKPGWLDGNSYNRDDVTNHLDWTDRAANPDLVDWYRRLVQLRKEWLLPAFAELFTGWMLKLINRH